MADVYTPFLQLNKQGVGTNENTWGQLLNDEVIQRVEDAIAGINVVTTTGGTVTLTDDQARKPIQGISGTLTSNLIIVVPARPRMYTVINGANRGAFTIVFKGAGSSYTMPGISRLISTIVCNGGDVYLLETGGGDIGSIIVSSNSFETNCLVCFGQAVSRTTYAALFAKIGTTWGSGDGSTTFNVPATDTRYVRGAGSIGPSYMSQAILEHTHTATTDSKGLHAHNVSITEPAGGAGHRHAYAQRYGTTFGGTGEYVPTNSFHMLDVASAYLTDYAVSGITGSVDNQGGHTHDLTTSGAKSGVTAIGSAENRPNSVLFYHHIRAF